MAYIDSGEDYHKLPSLEEHYALLNPRQSPAQSVDVEVNANVVPYVNESLMDAVPKFDDDWGFKGAVGLDEMDRVGVKRHSRDLIRSRRVKCRKVPGTVTEAMELAEKLFKLVSESESQAANNTTPVTQSAVETEIVFFSANLKKACGEENSAKADLDALRVSAESATKEQNVA